MLADNMGKPVWLHSKNGSVWKNALKGSKGVCPNDRRRSPRRRGSEHGERANPYKMEKNQESLPFAGYLVQNVFQDVSRHGWVGR